MFNENIENKLDAYDTVCEVSSNLKALSEILLIMNDSENTMIEDSLGFFSDTLLQQHKALDAAMHVISEN